MTREDHVAQSKQRALDYLDHGELANAVASMISDMQDIDIDAVSPELMHAGGLAALNHNADSVRRFIEGFR